VNNLIPGLREMLKIGSDGEPIRFSGGPRSLFLHPKAECQSSLLDELQEKLSGAATVMSIRDLGEAGFFGPKPISDSFAQRLGSIALMPHDGYSVYWEELPAFEPGSLSSHGGASRQEMETPLLLLSLG
jgi:hypothetical protein